MNKNDKYNFSNPSTTSQTTNAVVKCCFFILKTLVIGKLFTSVFLVYLASFNHK